RSRPVTALATWPDNAAMKHSRHADAVHVGERAHHLGWDIDPRHLGAHQAVLADRLGARRSGYHARGEGEACDVRVREVVARGDRGVEPLAAEQLAVTDALTAAGDDATFHRQAADRHAKTRRSKTQQRLFGRRCGRPNLRTVLRDPRTTGRDRTVWRDV